MQFVQDFVGNFLCLAAIQFAPIDCLAEILIVTMLPNSLWADPVPSFVQSEGQDRVWGKVVKSLIVTLFSKPPTS